MNKEELIHLDLSVETLALLGKNHPEGPLGTQWTDGSAPPRCCGGGSENTPPRCCP